MKLPLAEEYLEIINQPGAEGLTSLRNYRFVLDSNGKTLYEKSRHAIVFKAENDLESYAIRFFLHDDVELFRRYHEIQNYLEALPISWKVPFEFLDEEYYPAIKMDWVDGLSFTEYVDLIISQPLLINQLQSKLVSLSRSFEENGVGHGNLNLKHIRLVRQGQDYILKLIDYDSMFIPSFRDMDSLGAGTSSFQHPMRLASDFSETIDRFSIWIFLTALEAFKTDSLLWTNAVQYGYDKSKQILFSYKDLAVPQQSKTFQIIRKHNNEALNFYADKLINFCTSKSLNDIEAPHLYHTQNVVSIKRNETPLQGTKPNFEYIQNNVTKETPVINSLVAKEESKKVSVKENVVEEKAIIHLKTPLRPQKEKSSSPKKNKTARFAVIAIIAALALTSFYFLNTKKSTGKISIETKPVQQKVAVPVTQQPSIHETVFIQENITQFLFGLYQSYNKRDLQGILSNYSDSLGQYYDASAITKDKLSKIIKDLFIKPAYYECHPDLRTLQFNVQGDVCKLSIAVNETIKANKRSKTENYSSKIEYTVDRSLKILSEKNID